jgi:3-hydroxypropanoate dehydrogenase
MEILSGQTLNQLFTEARTYNSWAETDVTDAQLHKIYELTKFGPTSANACPARFVFVRKSHKEKLLACVSEFNVEKVKAAPVTAIIAYDQAFYDQLPKLLPHAPQYREMFKANSSLAQETAFRNGTLQGAYFILAARAVGLSCGPMSGFDKAKVDAAFFTGTQFTANFLCNLGHGAADKLFPRQPRLSFAEACTIV